MILWDRCETDTFITTVIMLNADLHSLAYAPIYISAGGCPHFKLRLLNTGENIRFRLDGKVPLRSDAWPMTSAEGRGVRYDDF